MKYPEHEKLRAVQAQSQAIGEFVDWLCDEHGVRLATYDDSDYLQVVPNRLQSYLAKFFGIDEARLEAEKRAMLDEIRGVAGDRCESGNECGRTGCPECQQ